LDTAAVAWSREYLAFVADVAVCYDCRTVHPHYCREAAELHRAFRESADKKPSKRRRR
jgi:hypothetical protein